MKAILGKLFDHKKLSKAEAKDILINISAGKYNEAQISAFITVYLMRPIAVEELQGFREALLELCVAVDLDGMPSIDVCGTGGDGKNTFNISTLSAFVVAGAGYKVAKHGNVGVSSNSGSSDCPANHRSFHTPSPIPIATVNHSAIRSPANRDIPKPASPKFPALRPRPRDFRSSARFQK